MCGGLQIVRAGALDRRGEIQVMSGDPGLSARSSSIGSSRSTPGRGMSRSPTGSSAPSRPRYRGAFGSTHSVRSRAQLPARPARQLTLRCWSVGPASQNPDPRRYTTVRRGRPFRSAASPTGPPRSGDWPAPHRTRRRCGAQPPSDASASTRSMTSSNDRPAAVAALGSRLVSVIPGIGLISSTQTCSSASTIMSTRPKPRQPSAA